MERLKFYKKLAVRTFSKYSEDDIFTHAAALSYYTIFSLPPMLLVVIFTATRFYDETATTQIIKGQISELVGMEGAEELMKTLTHLDIFKPTIWATILGFVILLFTSTTVFITIQNTLNKIFKVKPKPGTRLGLYKMLRDRILSFGLLIGLAFILLVSLTINTLIAAFTHYLEQWIGSFSLIITMITSMGLPVLIITFLFAIVFKLLPDAKLEWKDTWVGAFVTAILYLLGEYLISFYIGKSDVAGLYDAAGSIMVIMVWVFYASLIFFLGAVFTYVRTKMVNGKIRASDYAVKIELQKVEKQ